MENKTLDSSLIGRDTSYTDADLANGLRRFANYLIDTLMVYILFFVFITVLYRAGSVNENLIGINYTIYLVMLGYYTIMEFATGKTVGKMITGTRVITVEGSKPDLKTAFIRSLCRFIPFEAFSFLGSPCKGWHDTIAGSRVVFDR